MHMHHYERGYSGCQRMFLMNRGFTNYWNQLHNQLYVFIYIYIYLYIYIYIYKQEPTDYLPEVYVWVNYNDLFTTSPMMLVMGNPPLL